MKFIIYWLDGKFERVEGETISQAFTNAGYGCGAINAIDFYSQGDIVAYKWSEAGREWCRLEEKCRINLSAPQSTEVGSALFKFYYSRDTEKDALLNTAPGRSGYPHNGGEHTLYICGEPDECIAWLELFAEAYVSIKAEVERLITELRDGSRFAKLYKLA